MIADTDRLSLLQAEARRIRRVRDLPVRPELPPRLSLAEAATLLHQGEEATAAELRERGIPIHHAGEMGESFVPTEGFFAFYARRREESWAELMRLSAEVGLDDDTIDFASLNTRLG